MTEQEFYEYFNKTYCNTPLAAQVKEQARTIFYLKMELAKLKKQLNSLSSKKEE